MSEKHEATWHGGEPATERIDTEVAFPLPQRTPFETLATFDRTAPHPVEPGNERPWASPGVPPWGSLHQDIGHEPRRRAQLVPTAIWTASTPPAALPPPPTGSRPQWPLAVAVGVLVVVVAILALAVRSQNVAPAWVPVIGMDSGVALCKAISESNGREIKAEGSTPEQVAAIREMFADSRYPAIRDNGVQLMDIAAQVDRLGDDLAALTLVMPMVSAYAGLAGGCQEQGYTLPSLAGS